MVSSSLRFLVLCSSDGGSTVSAPLSCLFLSFNCCVATQESYWEYKGQLVYKYYCSIINLSINNPLLSVIAGYKLCLSAMETIAQVTQESLWDLLSVITKDLDQQKIYICIVFQPQHCGKC